MMLEIALDADEEWDSSSSWDQLVRDAAEAAATKGCTGQTGMIRVMAALGTR